MNTDLQASRNTYYIDILDDACLFSLLIRLQYNDLLNICRAKPYLWRITCTPWFQESWQKYNVRTEVLGDMSIQLDLYGKRHGKFKRYTNNGKLIEEIDYVNDVMTGYHNTYRNRRSDLIKQSIPYVNGIRHGIHVIYHNDDDIEYKPFINGKLTGIVKYHHGTGVRTWTEFVDGRAHGKSIRWYHNGSLEYLRHFNFGKLHGISRHWHNNGTKLMENTHAHGTLLKQCVF
jgi:antitoxin component YwqK of YwqJK toxin-antitoxin module